MSTVTLGAVLEEQSGGTVVGNPLATQTSDPIGNYDLIGGNSSPTVNGRRQALLVVPGMNNGASGTLLDDASFKDAGFGANLAAVGAFIQLGNAGAIVSIGAFGLASAASTSAANVQIQTVVEIRNLHQVLDIISAASGGTSTLLVEASRDNATWFTIDSIAAALSNVKHYNNTTVGASTAVTPLAFRYVRITSGAAGVGNTVTQTVLAK